MSKRKYCYPDSKYTENKKMQMKPIRRIIKRKQELISARKRIKDFLVRYIDVYYFVILIMIIVAVYLEDIELLKMIVKFILTF